MTKTPPAITVCCKADGQTLLNISLHLSRAFSFQIEGASEELGHSLLNWKEAYLNCQDVPYHSIGPGTLFQQTVWKAMLQIPFGSTLSYGEVAAKINHPNAQRAVGSACNKNPFPLLVPCHRIIQANNRMGGFALNLEVKRRLLDFENSERFRSMRP